MQLEDNEGMTNVMECDEQVSIYSFITEIWGKGYREEAIISIMYSRIYSTGYRFSFGIFLRIIFKSFNNENNFVKLV